MIRACSLRTCVLEWAYLGDEALVRVDLSADRHQCERTQVVITLTAQPLWESDLARHSPRRDGPV